MPEEKKKQKMVTANAVCWFEIPTQDLASAKRFYSDVLGVSLQDYQANDGMQMALFPMEADGKGSAGALVKGVGTRPSNQGATIFFNCTDVAQELTRAKAHGVRIIKEKTPVGEHGFIALFEDNEGSRIGLHSTR